MHQLTHPPTFFQVDAGGACSVAGVAASGGEAILAPSLVWRAADWLSRADFLSDRRLRACLRL